MQRKCTTCEKEDKKVLQKTERTGNGPGAPQLAAPPIVHEVLGSPGQRLDTKTRTFMESRFGYDFSSVRVHNDAKAAESARSVNARAYTVGSDVVFDSGQFAPHDGAGQKLMAHELAHVVQQHDSYSRLTLQRTLNDGHDLTSPRFSRLLDLEEAYDGETKILVGSSGRGVQAIQQALYDLGYPLPSSGADGKFGSETDKAVRAFQKATPPLVDDGKVGKNTMATLDAKFKAPVLPAPAVLNAPWTIPCVRSLLCPWSPHTINVLKTRITMKSFDSISWADEKWDGASWVIAPFPGGGYNTGTEIGVLNSSCEHMSQTLYHEVLHADQPKTHSTTIERESYAYRIGEEFTIAMGFKGRPKLRSTDAQGRQFADPAKINTSLAPGGSASYPGVTAGGGGDEIIGKAAEYGKVRVSRPDGTIYIRPAVVGEKVPGPMSTVNEVTHPAVAWTCP